MSVPEYLDCDFCYRHCHLKDGQIGYCGMRERVGEALLTRAYGGLVATAVDPVEKKPLYHFLPGTNTLSIAMFGCNLTCSFCQNYSISQKEWESDASRNYRPAKDLIQLAKHHHCQSISFTYSEPLVWQDYMIEVATLAKRENLKTIMVTNGTFSEEALARIYKWIDAFNIDLKGDEDFYRNYCGGSSRPVWQSIEQIAQGKAHLEVTTLVMEGVHTLEKLTAIGERLSSSGVQVWHLSRYFPHYKEQRQATSEAYMKEVVKHARMLPLPFVYPGNSTLDQNTYCPYCKTRLVSRSGIGIDTRIIGDCCPKCGKPLYGHW